MKIIHKRSTLFISCLLLTLTGCKDLSSSLTSADYQRINTQEAIESAARYRQQGQLKLALSSLYNALQHNPTSCTINLQIGREYSLLGEYEKSEQILNNSALEKCNTVETNLIRVTSLLGQLQYQPALKIMQNFPAKQFQTSTQLMLLAGIAHMGLGNYKDAETHLNRASQIDANSSAIILQRAKLAHLQSNTPESEKLLEIGLLIEANDVPLLLFASTLDQYYGRLSQAKRKLTKVVDILSHYDISTPEKIIALRRLTYIAKQQGNYTEFKSYQEATNKISNSSLQVKYEKAYTLYEKGFNHESLRLFSEIVNIAPNHIPAKVMLGVSHFKVGHYNSAKQILSNIDSHAIKNHDLNLISALTLLELNEPKLAIKKVIRLKENQDPRYMAITALSKMKAGKNEEGVKILNEAYSKNPDNTYIAITLANIYRQQNRYLEAKNILVKALEKSSNSLQVLEPLIYCFYETGDIYEAETHVLKTLKNHPDNSDAFVIAGNLSNKLQRYNRAENFYKKSLAIRPDNFRALQGLSLVYSQQREWEKAKITLLRIAKNMPENEKVLSDLLIASKKSGSVEDTLDFLSSLTSLYPKTPQPWLALIDYKILQGESLLAENAIKKVHEIFPEHAEVNNKLASKYNNLAKKYLSLNTKVSREYIEKALHISNGHAESLKTLGYLEIEDENWNKVLRIIKKIQNTHAIPAKELLAKVYSNRGKHNKAIHIYEQLWSVHPSFETVLGLYNSYRLQGESLAALSVMENWIQQKPHDISALKVLARNYLIDGKEDKALEFYRKALKHNPKDVESLNNIAHIYNNKNDERSKAIGELAYIQAPNNVHVLDTYGWSLVRYGNIKKGIALLKKAYALQPYDQDIKQHLDLALKEQS